MDMGGQGGAAGKLSGAYVSRCNPSTYNGIIADNQRVIYVPAAAVYLS